MARVHMYNSKSKRGLSEDELGIGRADGLKHAELITTM